MRKEGYYFVRYKLEDKEWSIAYCRVNGEFISWTHMGGDESSHDDADFIEIGERIIMPNERTN